jgi:hypothetical protein
MAFRKASRLGRQIVTSIYLATFSSLMSLVRAEEELRCTTPSDRFIGNAQSKFAMTAWMNHGRCIRSQDGTCYLALLKVLDNLVELRKAEYGGAAGVLALLPTIGALLGAPTNEVWTLLTILPFGGGLAMALSFGGAIMPVRVEDYELAMKKRNIAIGSIVSFRSEHSEKDKAATFEENLGKLDAKVSARISYEENLRPGRGFITVGLVGMFLLLIGAQSAMAVVEQGGLIPWWCSGQWWMHLWYFMGTLQRLAGIVRACANVSNSYLYCDHGEPSSATFLETAQALCL